MPCEHALRITLSRARGIKAAQTWVRLGGTLASLHRPLGYPIGGPHHFCTDLPGQGDTFGLEPITSAQTPGHPMRLPWLLCTDLGFPTKGSRKQELGQPFVRRRGAEKIHTDSHSFFQEISRKCLWYPAIVPGWGPPTSSPGMAKGSE